MDRARPGKGALRQTAEAHSGPGSPAFLAAASDRVEPVFEGPAVELSDPMHAAWDREVVRVPGDHTAPPFLCAAGGQTNGLLPERVGLASPLEPLPFQHKYLYT